VVCDVAAEANVSMRIAWVQQERTDSFGLLGGVELVVRWLSVTMLKFGKSRFNIAAADLRVRAKRDGRRVIGR